MADSDDPIVAGKTQGVGELETIPLTINGKLHQVKTGGKPLELFVRNGRTTFTLNPLDTTDWELKIRKPKP